MRRHGTKVVVKNMLILPSLIQIDRVVAFKFLTDAQTALFPDELYYDVLLENSSGEREYYLEGVITVSEGYTTP